MEVNPKQFVKNTILTSDKERIKVVMNRYWEYNRKKKEEEKMKRTQNSFEIAKKIFGVN